MPYKVDVDGVVCQISTDSLGIGWIFGGEKDWRMEREIAPSFSINCHQLHGLSLKLLPPPTVLQYRHQFAISLVSVISRIALILSIACCCCLCRGTGAVQNLQSARSSSLYRPMRKSPTLILDPNSSLGQLDFTASSHDINIAQ